MSDALIPAAAAAQVAVIEASLTRSPGAATGYPDRGSGSDDQSWLAVWDDAVDILHRLGRGSRHQCTRLVWSQIDLAADLRHQSWWADPRLRRAAVGQIAWTTTLGRWPGSVPTADAQHRWATSHWMTGVIHRRLAVTPLGHSYVWRERRDRVAELRRGWEDAWWAWATRQALDDHPLTISVGVDSRRRGPGVPPWPDDSARPKNRFWTARGEPFGC